jgi:FkbM family methyltransferase
MHKITGLIRRASIRLAALCQPEPDSFLASCRHVVHVGANAGQERDIYESHRLSVTWVEPIPTVFDQLEANIGSYPNQTAVRALVADRAGVPTTLNISSNSGASSSIFGFALHKDIWPHVDFVDTITMKTETLDHLVAEKIIRSPIDALIIDTQGAELLVLKGAAGVLQQVRYVKAEAADFESYSGGATAAEIEKFMNEHSFRLVRKTKFAQHPTAGAYYDLLFERDFP